LQAGVVMPFLLFWFSFCASPDYFLRVCKSAHIRFFIRNLTAGVSGGRGTWQEKAKG